jgi:hypothetical protein
MSWLNREKTPGGAVVIQYGKEAPKTPIGFTDQSTAGFGPARESVYQRLFGEALNVSHELIPLVPHVDVYSFRRTIVNQEVYTLVTGGMSDLPMALPSAAAGMPKRVELIFYCSEPREEYIGTLRWLAHFPHTYKTCVGCGHTIPNGNPPEPFWGSDCLDTILFLPPIVQRDRNLADDLILGGDPVSFLWVVPITGSECNLKLQKGLAALMDLFSQHRHPHVFDPARKSYV